MQQPISDILHSPGGPTFLNTALLAPNVFEIDVPASVVAGLTQHVVAVRDMETIGETFSLENGVRLFVETPGSWRSDIRWLSHADEPSYRWFEEIFEQLGLGTLAAPLVPHDRALRLYGGFFVTRSRCDAVDLHADWLTRENHAFTLMTPLTANALEMGLTYEDVRGQRREYAYRLGRGVVFGSHFYHSTAVGQLDERAVFLCLTFGTDRMEHWPELARTAGTQGDFFRQPDGTFIHRSDWLASGGARREY